MTYFVVTPDLRLHESEDWLSLPREVVKAGDCKYGVSQDGDYYRLVCGRPVAFNTPLAYERAFGKRPEDDPAVKLGTMLPDDEWNKACKAAQEASVRLNCGGCS